MLTFLISVFSFSNSVSQKQNNPNLSKPIVKPGSLLIPVYHFSFTFDLPLSLHTITLASSKDWDTWSPGEKTIHFLFNQDNNKTFEVHNLHINTFHSVLTIYNDSGKLKLIVRWVFSTFGCSGCPHGLFTNIHKTIHFLYRSLAWLQCMGKWTVLSESDTKPFSHFPSIAALWFSAGIIRIAT